MARPFGSKTRPQIRQFMYDDDIRDIMAVAIKEAKKGNAIMAKFLLEQIFGKAPQSMDLTSKGESIIPLLNYVKEPDALRDNLGDNKDTETNKKD